ncbi:MAG: hypothetical protein ACRDRJ_15675 [Streptosporangiaceae bacterium]
MSHHLDTPLARQNGRLYIDDLYVFPGPDSTVLVMDVNSTITGPDIQPGFHPEGRYKFKVYLDDADYEALTYRSARRVPAGGRTCGMSAWRPAAAQNSFAGTTVESIVLEVSHQHPLLRPGARTGVWCTTRLATR